MRTRSSSLHGMIHLFYLLSTGRENVEEKGFVCPPSCGSFYEESKARLIGLNRERERQKEQA